MPKPASCDLSMLTLPTTLLPRPRLSEAMLSSSARAHLLFAPAGYGKTVLLNQCALQAPAASRLIWLDLAGANLSPAALLQRIAKQLGQSVGKGDVIEVLLDLLVNAGHLWVVIDDYPRLDRHGIDEFFNQLLLRAPSTVSWWISSRRLPEWSVSPLLLQGGLVILDRPSLALTRDELSSLLALSPAQPVGRLVRQCLFTYSAGWLAVVLMLLESSTVPLRQRLQEGTALLAQYLQVEVLSEQPVEGVPTCWSSYQGHAPEAVIRRFSHHGCPGCEAPRAVLSMRELAVLRLIAQGSTNQEIADQLLISLHTVKTHNRRINRKLSVTRRTQAVSRAKALGYLSH